MGFGRNRSAAIKKEKFSFKSLFKKKTSIQAQAPVAPQKLPWKVTGFNSATQFGKPSPSAGRLTQDMQSRAPRFERDLGADMPHQGPLGIKDWHPQDARTEVAGRPTFRPAVNPQEVRMRKEEADKMHEEVSKSAQRWLQFHPGQPFPVELQRRIDRVNEFYKDAPQQPQQPVRRRPPEY